MKKGALLSSTLLALTACSQGVTTMTDRTSLPCGDKPNCVSTQDAREKHQLVPFTLGATPVLMPSKLPRCNYPELKQP